MMYKRANERLSKEESRESAKEMVVIQSPVKGDPIIEYVKISSCALLTPRVLYEETSDFYERILRDIREEGAHLNFHFPQSNLHSLFTSHSEAILRP